MDVATFAVGGAIIRGGGMGLALGGIARPLPLPSWLGTGLLLSPTALGLPRPALAFGTCHDIGGPFEACGGRCKFLLI